MKAVIVGAGGFGREVADLARACGFELVGFIDPAVSGEPSPGIPILGGDERLGDLVSRQLADAAIVAIGDPRARQRAADACARAGLTLPPIVHPSATILTRHPIGDGAIVYPQVVVMSDCRIGAGVLLNSGATLGHDVLVGECANVGPGAHIAGRVTIGARTIVGIGAIVREKIAVGIEALVGAGSVVVKDVADNAVVYGVPAMPRVTRV